jgi:hypothetical protein
MSDDDKPDQPFERDYSSFWKLPPQPRPDASPTAVCTVIVIAAGSVLTLISILAEIFG